MDTTSTALLRQANLLIGQGPSQRLPAIECLRQLLARRPDHAGSWFNLGYLHAQGGRFDDALAAYAEALRHGVADPQEVHLNRAVIYADHLQQPDRAKQELALALSRSPHYLPALLNLGNLHEEQGEREAAIACYQRLRQVAQAGAGAPPPLALEALARLAQLQPPSSQQDPLLAELEAAAGSAGADDAIRGNLWFALGKACDGLDLADRAFAAFTHGKHHAHRSAPGYSAAAAEAAIDRLIGTFAQPVTGHAQVAAAARPVFICGMFRSGSTLIEQALAAHPEVAAGGELDLLPRLLAGPLAPFPQAMAGLSAEALSQLSAYYRREAQRRLPGLAQARVFTDKRPDNFLLVGLIKRLFPDALIVHTVRNPLDNGLAIYMQHLNPRAFPYAGRLQDIGHHHAQHERLMRHWQRLYPDAIHRFDYDAYVADPQPVLAALLRFLGLGWEPRCLDFHTLKNTVRTASYWQVRQPLYTGASGRWQRYRQHLMPLREALAKAGIAMPA